MRKTHCSIQVSFLLTANGLDPRELTRFIGTQPTRTWRKGDQRGRTSLKFDYDCWRISTGSQRTDELQPVLQSLLVRLAPYADRIVEAINQYNVEAYINCAIYAETGFVPSMEFGRRDVEMMARLRSEIGIDLMHVAPD